MPITYGTPIQVWIGNTVSQTWVNWNLAYTNTSSTTCTAPTLNQVGAGWNQAYAVTGATSVASQYGTQWINWNTAYQETEDQRAEREQRQAEAAERYEQERPERERRQAEAAERNRRENAERAEQHEQARARAEELLVSLLSDEQAADLREHDWFLVRGSESGRTYRVRRGITGNIDRLTDDGNRRDMNYCAHPQGLPEADVNLSQLLLIATDEPQFLKIANAQAITRNQEVIPINRRRERRAA